MHHVQRPPRRLVGLGSGEGTGGGGAGEGAGRLMLPPSFSAGRMEQQQTTLPTTTFHTSGCIEVNSKSMEIVGELVHTQ